MHGGKRFIRSSDRSVTSKMGNLKITLIGVLLIAAVNSVHCRSRPTTVRPIHIRTTTASLLIDGRDPNCQGKNGYFPVEDQCDAYIECKDWKSQRILCPDGLLFKPGTPYKSYPCVYPSDVSCDKRRILQHPLPTAECPHLYGFFRAGDMKSCGVYHSCVDGKAFELKCPEGLAYNTKTSQCDWPDVVEDCDVEEYLGFACPGLFGENSSANPINYRHPDDCNKYFACINGKPRLLSCGEDKVFDEYSGQCESSDVSVCEVNQS